MESISSSSRSIGCSPSWYTSFPSAHYRYYGWREAHLSYSRGSISSSCSISSSGSISSWDDQGGGRLHEDHDRGKRPRPDQLDEEGGIPKRHRPGGVDGEAEKEESAVDTEFEAYQQQVEKLRKEAVALESECSSKRKTLDKAEKALDDANEAARKANNAVKEASEQVHYRL